MGDVSEVLPTGLVTCECGGGVCREDSVSGPLRRYTCKRCKRFVPFCYGGSDGTMSERDQWCNACWAQTEETS